VIAGLYEDKSVLPIQGTVKYRDGKEATIHTQLTVVDVDRQASPDGEVA
jgi:hypothetical protein